MLSSNNRFSTANTAAAIATNMGYAAANTFLSTSKPKRPLSSYNLFYRYKRSKVLEATARLQRSAGSNVNPAEEKRVIEGVQKAPSGLEGVPPGHAVWSFPTPAVNELRARNIRHTMAEKLLPNENTRRRVHRKVHGIGFVEMGKAMRDMWTGIDGFAKGVFCELAGVGRARYRAMIAEYKLKRRLKAPVLALGSGENSKAKLVKREQFINPNLISADAIAAGVIAPTTPTAIEATSNAPKKPSILGFVSPSPVVNVQRPVIQAKILSLCPLPRSYRRSNAHQASISGAIVPVSDHDENNKCPSRFDKLEPLSVPTLMCGRCESTQSEDVPANFADFLRFSSDGNAHQDINNVPGQYLKSAAIPPLPLVTPASSYTIDSTMFQRENSDDNVSTVSTLPNLVGVPRRNNLTDLERAILSDSSAGTDPEPIAPHKDGSTQNLLKLIGTLDEALDGLGMHGISEKVVGCPAIVFGRPIHDVHMSNPALLDTRCIKYSSGARLA